VWRKLVLTHFPLVLGFIAGCVSTYAFVPQVLKIWRERDCVAISLKMYLLRLAGFALWLVYGIALGSLPLIFFNLLNLLLGGAILVFKLQAVGLCPDPKGWFRAAQRDPA
jgi:MtN3 and saliva related transmembrane protein